MESFQLGEWLQEYVVADPQAQVLLRTQLACWLVRRTEEEVYTTIDDLDLGDNEEIQDAITYVKTTIKYNRPFFG